MLSVLAAVDAASADSGIDERCEGRGGTRLLEVGERARLVATHLDVIRGRCAARCRRARMARSVRLASSCGSWASSSRAGLSGAIPVGLGHGGQVDGAGVLRTRPGAGAPVGGVRAGGAGDGDLYAAIEAGARRPLATRGLPAREREVASAGCAGWRSKASRGSPSGTRSTRRCTARGDGCASRAIRERSARRTTVPSLHCKPHVCEETTLTTPCERRLEGIVQSAGTNTGSRTSRNGSKFLALASPCLRAVLTSRGPSAGWAARSRRSLCRGTRGIEASSDVRRFSVHGPGSLPARLGSAPWAVRASVRGS
jgi:hypothetical protein